MINAFDDQLKETSMSSGSVTITATSASQTRIQTATRITRTIPAAIPAMTAMQIKIMKTKRKRILKRISWFACYLSRFAFP